MADNEQKPSVQSDGKSNPVLTVEPGAPESGSSVSFGNNGEKTYQEDLGDLSIDPTEAAQEDDLGETSEEDTSGQNPGEDGGSDETSSDSEALPDFDPANEEVLAAYDAKYLKEEDGDHVINLDAFNDELNANFAEGKLDINPGSRAYLKKTFGISDQLINDHLEGLKLKADQRDAEVYEKVGGKEAHDAMYAWAAGEGYTADQKAKYNAAVEKAKKGDSADLDEQLELLSIRFQRAGGKAPQGKALQVGLRGRRPSSPGKVAGQGGNPSARPQAPAAAQDVFASSEEHRVAQNEAYKTGDPAKIKAVSDKLARSMRQKGWR